VRRVAIPGAVGQSLFATALGILAAWAFGWGLTAGVIFGLAISVASTVVLVRVLADNNDLHTPSGHIAVGWLVVEDLFTVLVLVLLPAMFGGAAVELSAIPAVLGLALLKIGLLVAFTFVVGGRVIPWFLTKVAATRSRELFTLTILVVALGIAVGSSTLFGASMALGAFLAGMVVGRSDFSLRAAAEALPMRDAFAVLFFVSVGMLFDPQQLIEAPHVLLTTLAIVMLGKPLAALIIVLVMRYPLRVALSVSVALAQIGEFSFILAALGKQLGILEDAANNALVAAAIVSISVNPLLYRLVGPLETWLMRQAWLKDRFAHSKDERSDDEHEVSSEPRHRAIVVGYGPVGQTLARLLQENEIVPTIIEMNLETVKHLRGDNIRAVYGDATHRDTLTSAGVEHAASLFLTASSFQNASETIKVARELNPRIRIVARTSYLRDRAQLREAGADRVFSGEGEVALAMDEYLLQELGATPEQIDRERERLQADLFGKKRIVPATADGTPKAKEEAVP
ncbi:MAG TPA: cation:proton antiporter, partial [Pirellulaceae bacterium]|nr:cation:proton antiporter [Pirellulaceae bacterium]